MDLPPELTPDDLALWRAIVLSHPMKAIASDLGIHIHTATKHRDRISELLHLPRGDVAALVRAAYAHGILPWSVEIMIWVRDYNRAFAHAAPFPP